MSSPPASPAPDFTEYYDNKYHTEKIYGRPNLELTSSAIAQTVEEAEDLFEDATYRLQSAKERVEQLKMFDASARETLIRKAKLAEAELEKGLSEMRLLLTKLQKSKEKPEGRAVAKEGEKMTPSKVVGPSVFVKGEEVKAGRLKTRRSKRRNGSSRVRRHRVTRVSKRQNKA